MNLEELKNDNSTEFVKYLENINANDNKLNCINLYRTYFKFANFLLILNNILYL